ncbi:MAG TPA: hypothetical protein PLO62_14315 [Candidatus Hydrogenedentes bacterium]|nr:hypothetical protein [Candidatus Hydrogenedentota bacterium]HOS02049.1 hypothetical protein [Candidatus Hydrogenedentota bacterium]
MIQIELASAVLMYSAILLTIVAGIWAYTEFSVRRERRFLEKQYHWRCVFCGFTYLDESGDPVSQCPRCRSYNSVEDERAREVRPIAVSIAAEKSPAPSGEELRRNPSRRKRPHQRRRGPRRR